MEIHKRLHQSWIASGSQQGQLFETTQPGINRSPSVFAATNLQISTSDFSRSRRRSATLKSKAGELWTTPEPGKPRVQCLRTGLQPKLGSAAGTEISLKRRLRQIACTSAGIRLQKPLIGTIVRLIHGKKAFSPLSRGKDSSSSLRGGPGRSITRKVN